MKRLIIVAASVLILVICIVGLKILGSASSKAYLRSRATQWEVQSNKDGRFKIVIYRYPRLKDATEVLGFGQGFVQLQDASGRVLAEKEAEDLAQLNWFRWSSDKVTVANFAEWDLPQ